jgi:hypothetical protein
VRDIGIALDEDLPDHKTGLSCPRCGSTDVTILNIGYVAVCNKEGCGISFPFRPASEADAENMRKKK